MAKAIIITGASDGIGEEAARQLSARGEHVVVVGRSPAKTRAVAESINAPFHVADFTELDQVRRLAGQLLKAYPRIDVLANNAGGIFTKEATREGYDKTFQVNHLGGYLLTRLLMERLIESRASIIQTSSIGAKVFGHIDIDTYTIKGAKSFFRAYGDSKLANILFTKELHRRYHDQGVNAVAFHPGNIASNFGTTSNLFVRLMLASPLRLLLETSEKGGSRLAWLAEGTPGTTWQSGEYYEDNKIAPPRKVNPQANDVELARALWNKSAKIVGLDD